MDNRGFTLIELLIVVAIIGILAAIAVISYTGAQLKATRTEAYTNLQNLRLLEEQYFAENAAYTPTAGTGALINNSLPGFTPGGSPPGMGINYTYSLTNTVGLGLPSPVAVPYDGKTSALPVATTPCFIATATGIAKSAVANDVFAIDCNNNRNF